MIPIALQEKYKRSKLENARNPWQNRTLGTLHTSGL